METIAKNYVSTGEINDLRKEIVALDMVRETLFGAKLDLRSVGKNSDAWRMFTDTKHQIFQKFSEFATHVNGIYKNFTTKEAEMVANCPATNWGITYSSQGDSGYVWWMFPGSMSDEEIENYLGGVCGVWLEGKGINSAYDCTGKTFYNAIRLIRSKRKVLVKQGWGIDC